MIELKPNPDIKKCEVYRGEHKLMHFPIEMMDKLGTEYATHWNLYTMIVGEANLTMREAEQLHHVLIKFRKQ